MKTHGCPHINSCSSCLLPSAFLVSLSILFLLYLPPHPSTLSFSTSSHTNSLTMTSSDVSSVYSPATAEETHQRVNETDLSLCLSLSSSANMGLNSGKGCSRVFGNESVKESAESREMGNGGWFKGRMKRVNSETIGGEEQRKRRVFSLQLCEPSCEQVQLQGSIHSSPRSPAVGWPPLQTCRKNAVYTQQRSPPHENVEETTSGNSVECKRGSNFVKVVMDGMAIGRKVDLNAHDSYSSLALTLENMFQLPPILKDEHSSSTHWRLLDCASDYLLTYVDKDGDWMLLGDAPWENFVKSVKRLRISHSTINGSSSQLVGAKDTKKMNYITRHFVDFVNAQRL